MTARAARSLRVGVGPRSSSRDLERHWSAELRRAESDGDHDHRETMDDALAALRATLRNRGLDGRELVPEAPRQRLPATTSPTAFPSGRVPPGARSFEEFLADLRRRQARKLRRRAKGAVRLTKESQAAGAPDY